MVRLPAIANLAGLLTMLGITASACAISSAPGTSSALSAATAIPTQVPLRIVYAQVRDSVSRVIVSVAQSQGFFAAEGVEVPTNVSMPSTDSLVESIANGTITLGAGTTEEAVSAMERGANVAIVAGYSCLPPYALIAQPHIRDAKELRGKSLAASSQVAREAVLLKLMLGREGLKYPDDYGIVVGASLNERTAAIESGSVAGALFKPPHDLMLMERGKKRLLTIRDAVDDYQSVVLLVDRGRAEDNPEATVRFLRALRRATRWIYDPRNKDEVIGILARSGRIEWRFAKGTYEIYLEQLKTLSADLKVDAVGLRRTLQVMVDSGALKPPAKPEKYLAMRYWEQAANQKFAE